MFSKFQTKFALVAAIVLIAVLFAGYFLQSKISRLLAHEIKTHSRILFEIKVIDEAGRPVQGASVEKDGQKVGTTDSFGEWRRYLQTQSGSILQLKISKQVGNQLWKVAKKYNVPEVRKNLFAVDDQELRNFEIKTSLKAARMEVVGTKPAIRAAKWVSTK